MNCHFPVAGAATFAVLCGAGLAVPHAANACSQPPVGIEVSPLSTSMPTDGPLLFDAWCYPSCEQDQLDALPVEVTRSDSSVVQGSVQWRLSDGSRALGVFTPAAEFEADSNYSVQAGEQTWSIDTTAPAGPFDPASLKLVGNVFVRNTGERLSCSTGGIDSCGAATSSSLWAEDRDSVFLDIGNMSDVPGWNPNRYLFAWQAHVDEFGAAPAHQARMTSMAIDEQADRYCPALVMEDLNAGERTVIETACAEHGDLPDLEVRTLSEAQVREFYVTRTCEAPLPGYEELFCELLAEPCGIESINSEGSRCELFEPGGICEGTMNEPPEEPPNMDDDDDLEVTSDPTDTTSAKSEGCNAGRTEGGAAWSWALALGLLCLRRRRRG